MENLLKRTVSLLLGAVVLTSLSSCESAAIAPRSYEDPFFNAYVLQTNTNSDSGTYSANLAYYYDSTTNTAAVAVGTCTDSTITIPSTYNSYSIVAVMESGFANDTTLTGVTFTSPSTITKIGAQAFKNTSLSEFALPDGVTALASSTFMDCPSLTRVTTGSYTSSKPFTTIGDFCFAGDKALSSFSISSLTGLTTIGECAFQDCVFLERAIFPSGFTTLGASAFAGCTKLGLIFFPSSIATLGDYAFKFCTNAWAFFAGDIPSGYDDADPWNYTYITVANSTSHYVPCYTNRSSISYADGYYYGPYPADSTTDIIIYLYNGTNPTDYSAGSQDLVIPATLLEDNVTKRIVGIDQVAFANHTELKSVVFSANLQFINASAFTGCTNLSTINLEGASDLKTIGEKAFSDGSTSNTAVTSLYFPASVTSIGNSAFYSYTGLTSLTFENTTQKPSQLTSIGTWAFAYATNSASAQMDVALPGSLTSIGTFAFYHATHIGALSFSAATSATTLSIDAYAFAGISYLKSLSFSTSGNNTVNLTGAGIFELNWGGYDKNGNKQESSDTGGRMTDNLVTIRSLYIPYSTSAGVQTIAANAFAYRRRLSIYCQASTKPSGYASGWDNCSSISYGDISNLDASSAANIPVYWNVADPSLTTTSSTTRRLIRYYLSGNTTYPLFDFVQTSAGATTLILSRYYFYGQYTASLSPTIPDTVTDLGVAYTVTSIGDFAFYWSSVRGNSSSANNSFTAYPSRCLTTLTVTNNITSIGKYAFSATGTLTAFGTGTTGTALYTFPTGLTAIGTMAFAFTGLLKVYLPATLTSLGETLVGSSPFLGCFNMTVLQVNGDATTDGQTYYSSGNAIYIAGNSSHYATLFTIADGAYSSSEADRTLTVPFGCSTLGMMSLRGQRQVQNLELPYSLTSIGSFFLDSIGGAFDSTGKKGYSNLAKVRFYNQGTTYTSAQCKTIEEVAFWGCTNLATMEMPAGLTTIGRSAFTNCSALKYFPRNASDSDTYNAGVLDFTQTSLTSLNYECFENCDAITSVIMSSGLSLLDHDAFNGCNALTSVSFNNSLTEIGTSAFINCDHLASLTTGSGLTSIDGNAFANDSAIATISLNSGLTTIGDSAFSGCTSTSLTSVTIPSSVTNVGQTAFNGDSSIATLNFGTSSTDTYGAITLKYQAFLDCSGLTSVNFKNPSNSILTTFNGLCFQNCTGLTSIVLPKGSKFSFSGANYPFLGCSNLNAIYMDMTGTYYDSIKATRIPAKFRWKTASGDLIPLYFHCATTADKSTTDTTAGMWHYVSGVPTVGAGADS
jgi:hypothetical protein